MTLTEFLLARIAEDEAESRIANLPDEHFTAQRVLAECEAKRQVIHQVELVAEYVDATSENRRHYNEETITHRLLAPLALPYADHPDYDEEWKP